MLPPGTDKRTSPKDERNEPTDRGKLDGDRRKTWFGKKETDSVRRKPANVRWKLHRDMVKEIRFG